MWPCLGVFLTLAGAGLALAAAAIDGVAELAIVEVSVRVVVPAPTLGAVGAPENITSNPLAFDGLDPNGDTKIDLNGALFTVFDQRDPVT